MTKTTIISGFLGAGKTTLIRKLISELYTGEKVVIIENEFGDTGIDGSFLKETGIQVTEMNSGCICCSLSGDFKKNLENIITNYVPDRIIIEPSGVGKLSEVADAVRSVESGELATEGRITVVDAARYDLYSVNFSEFFDDQIKYAECVMLSHTAGLEPDVLNHVLECIRSINPDAAVITTEWDKLSAAQIMVTVTSGDSFIKRLLKEFKDDNGTNYNRKNGNPCTCRCHEKGHHEPGCRCHCHDNENEHEHHSHECSCSHHADDVFSAWGTETTSVYTEESINTMLSVLSDESRFGIVLRAKGVVCSDDGRWLHFDYIPSEIDIRYGTPDVTGKICVIGTDIREEELESLFRN